MKHTLMNLPFAEGALEPLISKETISYHYGKHHQRYVDNLNKLIKGTEYEGKDLISIMLSSKGAIFNNAAQVANHDFYFEGMTDKSTAPSTHLLEMIERDFSTFSNFKDKFMEAALGVFGAGWTWLCVDTFGKLSIKTFSNAGNPLTLGYTPLLACDVWEHAYYIDYRNSRAEYLDNWWLTIDWEFVSRNLEVFEESKHDYIGISVKGDLENQYVDEYGQVEHENF